MSMLRLLGVFLLSVSSYWCFGQGAASINEAVVLLNSQPYSFKGASSPPLAANLGVFSCSNPLVLTGFTAQTARCGTCSLLDTRLLFRVYPKENPSAASGYQSVFFGQKATVGTAADCTTESWQNTAHNAILSENLPNGNYVLEMRLVVSPTNCTPVELQEPLADFVRTEFQMASPMSISLQPTPQQAVACVGRPVRLRALAQGATAYEWQRKEGNGWAVVHSAAITNSTDTLIYTTPSLFTAATYRLRLTNCGEANELFSRELALTPQQPKLTVEPQDVKTCLGLTVNLYALAQDTTKMRWQWQRSDAGRPFANLTADTRFRTPTRFNLQIANTIADNDDDLFRCILTDAFGCQDTTRAAKTTISRQTTITSAANTLCEKSGNLLVARILQGTVLSYQWKGNFSGTTYANLTEGETYRGVRDDSLRITSIPLTPLKYQVAIEFERIDMDTKGALLKTSCTRSETETLVINPLPPVAVAASVARCGGGQVTLSVPTLPTDPAATARWYTDTTAAALATGLAYSPTVQQTTTFFVSYVSSKGCEGYRRPVVVTVHPLPALEPLSVAAICPKTTSVTIPFQNVQNNPNLWTARIIELPDFAPVSDNALTGSGVTLTYPNGFRTGSYRVEWQVKNSQTGCSSVNYTTNFSVKDSLVVRSSGGRQAICEGNAAVMAVQARGAEPLSFQWLKEGVTLSVTNDTLPLRAIVPADAGVYRCSVQDACTTQEVIADTLYVLPKLVITQQPQNQRVCEGSSATFTIQAAGEGITTYQWKINGQPVANNNSSLTVANATASLANAQITCEVTAACGVLSSSVARLEVVIPPSPPVTASVVGYCIGSPTTALSATPLPGHTLRWWATATGGQHTRTAPLPTSGTAGSSYYYVSQETPEGCDGSRARIEVRVTNRVSVTAAAILPGICLYGGENKQSGIKAQASGGSGDFTYRWKLNGAALSPTTDSLVATQAGTYSVTAFSGYCSDSSTVTIQSVGEGLATPPTAADVATCAGGNVTLTAASVYQDGFFRWYDTPQSPTPVSGLNPLSIRNLTENKILYVTYWKVQDGRACETNRTPVRVSVLGAAVISRQPESVAACAGNTARFTVEATAGATFQWQRKLPSAADFEDISGATAATLSLSNVGNATNPHGAVYRVAVTLNGCPISSQEATLNVNSVRGSNESLTACTGSTLTLSLANYVVTGNVLSRQWQYRSGTSGSWTDLAATTASLVLTNLQTSQAGFYRCRVTFQNSDGSTCLEYTGSSGQRLIVAAPPKPVTQASDQLLCGNSVSLSSGNCTTTLRWQDGIEANPRVVSQAGSYTARCVQSGCESDTSNTLTITQGNAPVRPLIMASRLTLCPTDSVLLRATNCNGTLTWSNGLRQDSLWVKQPGSYAANCQTNCGIASSEALSISSPPALFPGAIRTPKNPNCSGYNPPEIVSIEAPNQAGQLSWESRTLNGNWQPIANATALAFNPSTLTETTLYRRKITTDCGEAYTPADTIFIAPEPTVALTAPTDSACAGQVIRLMANVQGGAGSCGLTFQRNLRSAAATSDFWEALPATQPLVALDTIPAQAVSAVYYRAVYACSPVTCQRATSAVVAVRLGSSPQFTLSVSDTLVCSGKTLTLTASGCAGTLRWADGLTATTRQEMPTQTTSYTARCTTACGEVSRMVRVRVQSELIALPQNTTPALVMLPDTLILSAMGSGLRWYTTPTSATAATVPPRFTAPGTYTRYVTQTLGTCESNRLAITATLASRLTITWESGDKHDCRGNSEYMSVKAVGVGKLTYQWQRKRPGELDFVNLSDADKNVEFWFGSDLRISNVGNTENPHQTQYRCVVGDETGSRLTTQTMTLWVNSLEGNLPNFNYCLGNRLDIDIRNLFRITGQVAAYQWQRRPGTSGEWQNLADGGRIVGAQSPQLVITDMQSADAQYYRCRVSFVNGGCTEATDASRAAVGGYPPAPEVRSITYCQYEKAVALTATLLDKTNDLRWFSSETDAIGSAKAPVPNTQAAGTQSFWVAQETALGCVGPKARVEVQINPKPAPPVAATPPLVKAGEVLVFAAQGSSLRWYSSLTGRTFSTTAPQYTAVRSYTHYVSQVSAEGCESDRTLITATIRAVLTVRKVESQADCEGNSVTFTAAASGFGSLRYQWQQKLPGESDFKPIPEATASRLTIPKIGSAAAPAQTLYRCLVSDSADSLFTNAATLIVNELAGTLPDIAVCEGNAARLDTATVRASGWLENLSWQFRNNGSWEAYEPTDAFATWKAPAAGSYRLKGVFRVDSKTTCTRYSNTFSLKINPLPQTPQPTGWTTCQQTPVSLTVSPAAKANTIRWFSSMQDSIGTMLPPKVAFEQPQNLTWYIAEQSGAGCLGAKRPVSLNILPQPTLLADTAVSYCQYATPQALKAASNGSLLWYRGNSTDATDTPPLIPTDLAGTQDYSVMALANNGCRTAKRVLKVRVTPCYMSDNELPTASCYSIERQVGKGQNWVPFATADGKIIAAINPNGQELGTVTLSIRGYLPQLRSGFGTSYFARYYHWQSSLSADTLPKAVSVRLFFPTQDLPADTAHTHWVHYRGPKTDCLFENNDNLGKGVSIARTGVQWQQAANAYAAEFAMNQWGEVGLASHPFADIVAEVKPQAEGNQVNWQATSEIRPLAYWVERRTATSAWSRWVTLPPQSTYTLLDRQPMDNVSYYRLVFQDTDGTRKYFPPLTARYERSKKSQCILYPNPVIEGNNRLYVSGLVPIRAEVVTLQGHSWPAAFTILEPTQYQIKLPYLHNGTYLLRLIGANETTCTVKFIK